MDKEKYIVEKLGVEPNSSGRIHCKCPFHEDRHPSFSIDVHKGLFICGSSRCGVRGSFVKFYKMMENVSWQEAREQIKDKGLVSTSELKRLFSSDKSEDKKIVNKFPQDTEEIGSLKYLKDRNLGQGVVQAFGLRYGRNGFAEGVSLENCIVAPIYDIEGEYRTFQVRHFSGKKRWFVPAESPVHVLLYGGWLVTDRGPFLFVVEGASDVWRLFTYRVQAVGLFTKEASSSQINKIVDLCYRYSVTPVIMLDGDVPEGGIYSLSNEVEACGLETKIIRLGENEDPGSLSYDRFSELKEAICTET